MADDEDIKFKLDLDNESFLKAGLEAKESIMKLGDSENLAGLLEGLTSTGIALAAVGVAAFAFKEAIDLTMEAEQINKVEESFKTLATNAGISANELKTGMEEAAGGLIDTNDLLHIANEALVKMGGSAAKLPEIMELARKATTVFGGDFKSNLDNITNAIANGNTKMLKHYGILVDSKKAVEDFAAANNLAVNEVTEAGKRQAILNAALEQGKKAFAGVEENMGSATNTLAVLKADFNDLKETFTLVFERVLGPGIRTFLHGLQGMVHSAKLSLQSLFGKDDAEKTSANIEIVEGKIKALQTTIASLEKKKGTILDFAPADTIARLSVLPVKLKEYQDQLEKLKKSQESLNASQQAGINLGDKGSQEDIANQRIKLANQIKFKAELEKIDKDYLSSQMSNVQTFAQIDKNVKKQNENSEKEHQTKLAEIRKNENLNEQQRNALVAAQERKFQADQMTLESKNDALRKKMLTNYVNNSKNALQGIGRAFAANSKSMQMELTNFGAQGQQTWDSFSKNSTAAFQTMGAEMAQGKDIAAAAADAMKSVFLNMLADKAIAQGSILLLSSIWPPVPMGLAAGAGLLALGGALKSLAGSSGGGSSVPAVSIPGGGSGGGGVSGGATDSGPISNPEDTSGQSASAANQMSMAQNAAPQRTVNVNIAGNYMETDSTRRQLMEMMRQETDATDFTYNKIGV